MTGSRRLLDRCLGVGVMLAAVLGVLSVTAEAQPRQDAVPAGQNPSETMGLSEAQLDRMLERLEAGESARLLNLSSFVVVVGRPPDVPLFGPDADLGSETWPIGVPGHEEMMAVTRPSTLDQAAGSDNLGIATATAFSVFVPMAVKAVAGWLGGDDEDVEGPRFAGYTRAVQIGGGPDSVSSLPFYRTGEQPVVMSMRVADTYADGVRVEIDGRELGVFEEGVADMKVPDELLDTERDDGLHLLTVSAAAVAPQRPVDVDLVVVVYATGS